MGRPQVESTQALFSQYSCDRLVYGSTLVVPVSVVYTDFIMWVHKDPSRPRMEARQFVDCLIESGCQLKTGGRGKLRRVVVGVGCRAKD